MKKRCASATARPEFVHVGMRLEEQDALAADGAFRGLTPEAPPPGRGAVGARDLIDRPEADVVTVAGVAVARIAEADEETHGMSLLEHDAEKRLRFFG